MASLVATRRRNPIAAEDYLAGWVFVLPALVIFVGFIFGPNPLCILAQLPQLERGHA